jgi:hypothetical protein
MVVALVATCQPPATHCPAATCPTANHHLPPASRAVDMLEEVVSDEEGKPGIKGQKQRGQKQGQKHGQKRKQGER